MPRTAVQTETLVRLSPIGISPKPETFSITNSLPPGTGNPAVASGEPRCKLDRYCDLERVPGWIIGITNADTRSQSYGGRVGNVHVRGVCDVHSRSVGDANVPGPTLGGCNGKWRVHDGHGCASACA